jgi:hypothetical protein
MIYLGVEFILSFVNLQVVKFSGEQQQGILRNIPEICAKRQKKKFLCCTVSIYLRIANLFPKGKLYLTS